MEVVCNSCMQARVNVRWKENIAVSRRVMVSPDSKQEMNQNSKRRIPREGRSTVEAL